MHTLTLISRSATHTFHWPAYIARHLIDALAREKRYRYLGDTLDFGDIKIECTDLSRVLHHVFDETEADAPPAVDYALQLLAPPPPPRPKRRRAPVPKEKLIRRRKEKVKAGAYITINAIAQELGMKPRDCRQALRKLGVPKPEHGWSWPPSEAVTIKSRLSRRVARQTPISKELFH